MLQTSKRWMAVVFACFALPIGVSPQGRAEEKPKPSEILQYSIEWRLVRAGTATLSRTPLGTAGWRADLHLESAGLVNKLFRVNDDYNVTFDPAFCASSTYMHAEEGSRRRETSVHFNRETKKSTYVEKDLLKNTVALQKELDIPVCVQDVVTALQKLRALKLEPGQSVQMPVTDGKRLVSAKIEAQEKETVKTPTGTYQTIRYEANLFNDVLYVRKGRLFLWMTNDDKKLLVQLRVRLSFPVGTISLALEKIDNP